MKGKKRVLFNEVPKGTKYRKGCWSWVSDSTADGYIEGGYGVEFEPEQPKKPKKQPKKEVIQPDSVPTMSNTKKEIEQYLDSKGIEYDEFVTKAQLLELM